MKHVPLAIAATLTLLIGTVIGAAILRTDDDDTEKAGPKNTPTETTDPVNNTPTDTPPTEEPTEPVDLTPQLWAPPGYDPTPTWGVEDPGFGTTPPDAVTNDHVIYLTDPTGDHEQSELRAYDVNTGELSWTVDGFTLEAETELVHTHVAVVDTGAGGENLTYVDTATGNITHQEDGNHYELPGSDVDPADNRATAVRRIPTNGNPVYVYPGGETAAKGKYVVNGNVHAETELPVPNDSYITHITATRATARVGPGNDTAILDLENQKVLNRAKRCDTNLRADSESARYSPDRTWMMFTSGEAVNLETGKIHCNTPGFKDGTARPYDVSGIDNSGRLHGRGLDAGWFTIEPDKKARLVNPDDNAEGESLFKQGVRDSWEPAWWFDDFVVVRGYRFNVAN